MDLPSYFPYICSQCGREYGQAVVPNSHGYCPVCNKAILTELKQRHAAQLRHFVKLCKHHNWSYQYVEDFREWERGGKESAEILQLQKCLDISPGAHKVIECAVNKYNPWRKIQKKEKNP